MDETLYPVSRGGVRDRGHRTSEAAYDFETDFLSFKGVRKIPQIAVHELCHFFEHCSTPYGAFRHEVQRLAHDCVERFLQEHQGLVFTPVYDWIELYLAGSSQYFDDINRAEFDALLTSTIKPWSRYRHFEDVIEGVDSAVVLQANVGKLIRILSEIEVRDNSIQLPSFSMGHCPTLTCDRTSGRGIPIGAIHVSECIAQIQEGFEHVDDRADPAYHVLACFGLDMLKRTEAVWPTRFDRQLDMTLLALADLALFTPIGQTYGTLRPQTANWRSIHPGCRFIDAAELVANNDWWICSLFEAEDLDNRICDALGWIRPRVFLDSVAQMSLHNPASLDVFTEDMVGESRANASVSSRERRHHIRHQAAAKIRLDDFMAFYRRDRITQDGSPIREFLEEFMPTSYYPGIGTVCNVPGTDNIIAIQTLRDVYTSFT